MADRMADYLVGCSVGSSVDYLAAYSVVSTAAEKAEKTD